MEILSAEFVMSNTDYRLCPAPSKPEYAFIGRSNVGKSSLINMLTNRNTLAKTSVKPGKTQLINHFLINKDWYVADLPGYGYAKVSKKTRASFHNFTVEFLQYRPNLLCVFVLLDSRIPAQKIDLEFMEYCGVKGIPFVMCFTKTDKLKNNELNQSIEKYKKKMFEQWEEIPRIFISSSVNKNGQDDILDFVENLNASYYDKIKENKD